MAVADLTHRRGYLPDFLPAFLAVGVAFLALVPFVGVAAFFPEDARVLPMTVNVPGPGTRVDSSPVDHLMPRSPPLTAVTTPCRGA